MNVIKHIACAPYHPSCKGLAERFVQTFKQSMKTNLAHMLLQMSHPVKCFLGEPCIPGLISWNLPSRARSSTNTLLRRCSTTSTQRLRVSPQDKRLCSVISISTLTNEFQEWRSLNWAQSPIISKLRKENFLRDMLTTCENGWWSMITAPRFSQTKIPSRIIFTIQQCFLPHFLMLLRSPRMTFQLGATLSKSDDLLTDSCQALCENLS